MKDTGPDRQPITMVIPCRAEYIGLCRLMAGVVGARESLEAEEIADLKLVVTEACTCFLSGPDGDPPSESEPRRDSPIALRVDFYILPEVWQVTVSDSEQRYRIPKETRCDPWGEGGLGLTIIRALVDVVDHTESEAGGSVIRLVKRLDPRPAEPR